MRFDAPVRVGWFRLSFCVADSDDKDIDIDDERFSSSKKLFSVNRFYPKTQLSWLARLDHSHCNSADPLTDGLEVCCVLTFHLYTVHLPPSGFLS